MIDILPLALAMGVCQIEEEEPEAYRDEGGTTKEG